MPTPSELIQVPFRITADVFDLRVTQAQRAITEHGKRQFRGNPLGELRHELQPATLTNFDPGAVIRTSLDRLGPKPDLSTPLGQLTQSVISEYFVMALHLPDVAQVLAVAFSGLPNTLIRSRSFSRDRLLGLLNHRSSTLAPEEELAATWSPFDGSREVATLITIGLPPPTIQYVANGDSIFTRHLYQQP